MKNETKENFEATIRLSHSALKKLKEEGFRYVQVKGFSIDRHSDYMSPHYLMLVPIKDLPDDHNKKEIYEPINSTILLDWASNDDMEVLIATSNEKGRDNVM